MIEGITGATAAAVGGAAVAMEIARAIKASGAIVRMESADFEAILNKAENPLVVHCQGKFLATTYQYLTAYKGLVFYCKTSTPLMLPHKVEVINEKEYGFQPDSAPWIAPARCPIWHDFSPWIPKSLQPTPNVFHFGFPFFVIWSCLFSMVP